MRIHFLAALAATALVLPGAAVADLLPGSALRTAQSRAPKPHTVILSVTAAGMPAAIQATATSGPQRLVSVDGVLYLIEETLVRDQVEAGTFTVIYPGTSIRWEPGDDRLMGYPPAWF